MHDVMMRVVQGSAEALLLILALVIPVLATKLVSFINLKITEIIGNRQDETEQKILAQIQEVLVTVINYVSQTFVDALKKQGEFTEEEQQKALEMAVQKSLELLSEEAKEFIMANYGDLQAWLVTNIESLIKVNKTK